MMGPVEVIAKFTTKGQPKPVKIRIESDLGRQEIMIDAIISQEVEKLAGNPMIKYQCQSEVAGQRIQYELKYEIRTCIWYLSTK